MKSIPGSSGPMFSWPSVFAVPGVENSLYILAKKNMLVLATNAGDSNAAQVKQALARAGLDRFFTHVYTAFELGQRKPDLDFFRKIEENLFVKSEDLIMVGDSYFNDILGAQLAGWKTVWYNPGFQFSPGLTPLHTAEIYHMDELPQALEPPFLPDWNTCLNWYQEKSPSMRLWLHVQLVASTAYILALWMRRNGVDIMPLLAQRGGLCHDICKLETIGEKNRGKDHGELGAKWLLAKGQPLLAEIADRHILDRIITQDKKPITLEEKVVFLADKLSEGSRLVSLDFRINELKKRYPSHAAMIESSISAIKDLQHELAQLTGFADEVLLDKIKEILNQTPAAGSINH